MSFKDEVDAVLEGAQELVTVLESGYMVTDRGVLQSWITEDLLPVLRGMSATLDYDNGGVHAMSTELHRRDQMMRRLLPDHLMAADQITDAIRAELATVPEAERDFDYCWGFIENTFRHLPENIAAVRATAKRAVYLDAAKTLEPTARELLTLRAELEAEKLKVVKAARALAAIRQTLDMVDPQ